VHLARVLRGGAAGGWQRGLRHTRLEPAAGRRGVGQGQRDGVAGGIAPVQRLFIAPGHD